MGGRPGDSRNKLAMTFRSGPVPVQSQCVMESYKLQCTAGQQSRAAVRSYTLLNTLHTQSCENGGKTSGRENVPTELVSIISKFTPHLVDVELDSKHPQVVTYETLKIIPIYS